MMVLISSMSSSGLQQTTSCRHHFADLAGGWIALFSDDAPEHIALGEDAGHWTVFHHQKRAELVVGSSSALLRGRWRVGPME
jgi:hypothetical protein